VARLDDPPQLVPVRFELVIVRANLPEKPIKPLLCAVLGIHEAIENPVAVPAIENEAGVLQVR
jgi:hypothetical protein